MDFQLTEEQILIQDMARSFSASELAPFSAKWDEKKFLDRNVFLKAAEMGFMGIYTSEEYGGTALSRLDCALVFEQLAAGDDSHTAMITIHNMATWMIDRYSSDEIRKKYVPGLTSGDLIASYCLTEPGSGSDAASLSTKAEKVGNEYILNGTKTFISGAGWSDIYLVMARTSDQGAKGVSTFIVEKDAPGLSFGATEKKMGWNAQPTAQIIMEDCKVSEKNRVGAEGEGFKFAMSGLDGGRINIGACSLGGAQKALNASIKYTSERKQFGKFISDFQNTEFMLADMATELEASRMMIYRGADMIDKGIANVSAACAMAKRYSTDMCSKIADNALQLHGGYGYLSEYEIEQIVRDLRVHQILEGTNQIMRVIISRSLLRQ